MERQKDYAGSTWALNIDGGPSFRGLSGHVTLGPRTSMLALFSLPFFATRLLQSPLRQGGVANQHAVNCSLALADVRASSISSALLLDQHLPFRARRHPQRISPIALGSAQPLSRPHGARAVFSAQPPA